MHSYNSEFSSVWHFFSLEGYNVSKYLKIRQKYLQAPSKASRKASKTFNVLPNTFTVIFLLFFSNPHKSSIDGRICEQCLWLHISDGDLLILT